MNKQTLISWLWQLIKNIPLRHFSNIRNVPFPSTDPENVMEYMLLFSKSPLTEHSWKTVYWAENSNKAVKQLLGRWDHVTKIPVALYWLTESFIYLQTPFTVFCRFLNSLCYGPGASMTFMNQKTKNNFNIHEWVLNWTYMDIVLQKYLIVDFHHHASS